MITISFDKLENVQENTKLKGSESILCDCFYNKKHYIYKQPNNYDETTFKKLMALSEISNHSFLVPEIFVYQTRPIGYLLTYLEGYESFYDISSNFNKKKKEKIKLLKLAKETIIKMHDLGIIHGDLHTANIMYKNDDIKIIDFESSKYKDYDFGNMNNYSKDYLSVNGPNISIDIYNFNIDTISLLYNYNWHFATQKNKLETEEQQIIWDKTKNKKKLTYSDFLIDRY